MTTRSEKYAIIPDCQSVILSQRALTTESVHFPTIGENNLCGLDRQLHVHLALLHPACPIPPSQADYPDMLGPLVVMERFVRKHIVKKFELFEVDDVMDVMRERYPELFPEPEEED